MSNATGIGEEERQYGTKVYGEVVLRPAPMLKPPSSSAGTQPGLPESNPILICCKHNNR